MKPSIGRIVHYVARENGEHRAAVVTEVDAEHEHHVGLTVFAPRGTSPHPLANGGAQHDEDGHAAGTWHWPEREDA